MMKVGMLFLGGKVRSRIISEISEMYNVSLDDAMDMFYNSETIQLMEEGVADLHCRSEKYLAEEVWERETFLMINSGVLERMMKQSLLVISMVAAIALPASSQEREIAARR